MWSHLHNYNCSVFPQPGSSARPDLWLEHELLTIEIQKLITKCVDIYYIICLSNVFFSLIC